MTGFEIEDYLSQKAEILSEDSYLYLRHSPLKGDRSYIKSKDLRQIKVDKYHTADVYLDEVKSIEVIYAKPTFKMEEVFGHAFFRVKLCDDQVSCHSELTDLAFSPLPKNYVESIWNVAKTFLFSFETYLKLSDFSEAAHFYLNHKRDLVFFDLDLSKEEKIQVFTQLIDSKDTSLGVWNTAYRSCNYHVQTLLLNSLRSRDLTLIKFSPWGTSPIELFDLIVSQVKANRITLVRHDPDFLEDDFFSEDINFKKRLLSMENRE